MHRLIVSATAFLVLSLGSSVTIQSQDGPSCGTDLAMANMSTAAREQMTASAAAFQSSELMLYLNFDGATVRAGFDSADNLTSSIVSGTRTCPAPSLTQAQKDEIVRLVRDDFSPFNIRVTADAAEFSAYPRMNREMCLITTSPSTIGQPTGVAGVSPFINLGLRLPNTFAFAFSGAIGNDPKSVALIVSHESAHLLGLGHQHLFGDACHFLSEYHGGFGSGPLAFHPLMGNGLGSGIDNWFAQACPDPFFGVSQDDYALINSQVIVRDDDFPDTPGNRILPAEPFTGILERAGDADVIGINFRGPGPVMVTSDNIDLKVSVLNPSGRVIEEFNEPDSTNVMIPSVNGIRYLKIEAASNANMSSQFMTGTYRVIF
jgi:hypothetical protein